MKDEFNRNWIIRNSLDEIQNYAKGVLTLRGLHYRLVSRGMTNTTTHYKRVISAMTFARWNHYIDFDFFTDNDREMIGQTEAAEVVLSDEIDSTKSSIKYWMENYHRNRWENQPYYPEVFIEKKALQGVFNIPCRKQSVALGACKGYPSLTFLNEAAQRFIDAEYSGKRPVILYFGDYDPSGEDIPRSIKENIQRLGCETIEVRRISLLESQVIDWKLPPAPVKPGDSRSANWSGLGQVELDAVEPKKLQFLCESAISSIFDFDLYGKLKAIEETERPIYQRELKEFVSEL